MIKEIILKEIVSITVKKSLSFFSNLLNTDGKENTDSFHQEKLEHGLSIHINKAIKFAESISVFRVPDTHDIESKSIPLSIAEQDRRFSSLNSKELLNENDLLTNEFHNLLLGDPGAGKTTTLKRLTKKIFELLFSSEDDFFQYSYPVVVRLGEIDRTETLFTHICEQLGIDYETHEKIIEYVDMEEEHYIENEKEYEYVTDPETGKKIQTDKFKIIETPKIRIVEVQKSKRSYEYKIGGKPIKYSISRYLDNIECILLLDGLDEVHFQLKEGVFNEIKELSHLLRSSKIILTSRYIQEISSFKQFKISEILPLNKRQKHAIATLWCVNPDLFFCRLEKLPYKDLTDRPLFLYYLIRLFENNNDELPNQAVDVYRQIVLLAIREWDEDKEIEIRRFSKYKSFDYYKREDFLSELAFELTYTQGVKKNFTHKQLEVAYLRIYRNYSELTLNDTKDILKDIEAHNGIITMLYNNSFEFSHLSIQEYLAAKYIFSIPFSKQYFDYFNSYTAPFAIATVLSHRPEEWLPSLFLHQIGEIRINYQIGSEKIYEYLNRLLIEKVHFSKPTVELGFAVIYLLFKYSNTKAITAIIDFLEVRYIKESIQLCLAYYEIELYENIVEFEIKSNLISNLYIQIPDKGSIEPKYIKELILETKASMPNRIYIMEMKRSDTT